MTTSDGGPAMPHLGTYVGADGNMHPTPTQYEGMSLREWYMGQALASWCETHQRLAYQIAGHGYGPQIMADVCVKIADAMLAARERTTP